LPGAVIPGAVGKITTLTSLLSPQVPVPAVPAVVVPQSAANTYLAFIVWQPGVDGTAGETEKAPPSMLYWTVNPETEGTDGNVKAEAQVLAGAVITGAAGNITTWTILLTPHGPLPVEPAAVVPQAAVKTYCAWMVWHPGLAGITGDEVNEPLLILY
jgi:hypothetical protein